MNGEAGAAFVDTNVLVYAFDRRSEPKVETAKELLNQLTATGRLRLSTQVLQELYPVLTRKGEPPYTPQEALIRLEYLSEWPIYINDYSAIRDAVVLSTEAIISFWDALILVAAARSGATVLYTEDLNHGQKLLGVTVVNPFR
jgi:predicted nucleic acid-binding protein